MKPWTLVVRFGLEIAALTGIALAAWAHTTGGLRILAAVAATVLAAALWATFNVPNDPSRSGLAPVVVSGHVRLILELAILGGGWCSFALAGHTTTAVGLTALTVLHYATTWDRVMWLLRSRPGAE